MNTQAPSQVPMPPHVLCPPPMLGSNVQSLPMLIIRSNEGPLTRIDNVSTSTLNSNSLWHINMKANQVTADRGSGYPFPYNVKLLKAVGLVGCLFLDLLSKVLNLDLVQFVRPMQLCMLHAMLKSL
ncbi:hypothetical protein VNO80_15481 [Phaseolus coccineus]|uniref:Uncharacterized protein n=1 Tax=Phaseolus coccineus TaxID=3886 RepID=A0AAN9MNT3_PHACN